MFRPPYLARVAAGAAVYALEETRRLPTVAIHLPITAISQLLQTSMHLQQFVTSLALKGDEVFDRLANRPVEQPEWATFDEDLDDEQPFGSGDFGARGDRDFAARLSRFDLFAESDPAAGVPEPAASVTPSATNGYAASHTAESDTVESATAETDTAETTTTADAVETGTNSIETAGEDTDNPGTDNPGTSNPGTAAAEPRGVIEPEVAGRYDYANMTLAQLRARLRMLSVEELAELLAYEQQTLDRAPFVTMLTNRIATVQAK
ncbi:lipid droplet-associated protein [Nocardia cerradoensis]|uniref:lipid droplet-associated protein n=1 Tax=Nocardia cerradoensis TaxID=85688 RepID=UPI000584FBDA|nr:lipid droplet-associated protein [Nocardia cerradoensis]NKY46089.1 lipid droplet-associated protein [Nocardia cerradoensis]